MAELIRAIKQASIDAINAQQPSAPFVGTVESASPLAIRLDQRLVIYDRHVVVLESVNIAEGDKVAVIRFDGGQKFLLLGKIK